MGKVTVKLNRAGVRELLRSDEMQAICMEHAKSTVNQLGDGYSANGYKGKNRVNAEVRADSYAAYRDNLKNNTILKALQ